MAETPTEAVVGSAVESEAAGVFPPFDPSTYFSQILWLAISFGILYYVMSKVALPRLGAILEERNDRIADDLAEAERLRQEADAAEAAYEQALAEARQNAHAIAAKARDKAKAKIDAKRGQVEEDIQERLSAAEARIAETKQKALADVGEIAAETAEAMVEHLLGHDVSRDEVDGAVKRVVNA